MKKRVLIIPVTALTVKLFSQNITLPEITTYIPATIEQKTTITAEQIQSAHYEDLSDILESTAIQNLAYGPYGLEAKPSIRGFTDETVRVVIDGICVNNAQYGTFDFSSINLSAVEKIEIVRGGFTEGVEDEGSVGGVIYITTRKMQNKPVLDTEASLKTYFNSSHPLDSVFQKISFSGQPGTNTYINTAASINYAENKFIYKYKSENYTRENAGVIDGQTNVSLSHYYGNGNCLTLGSLFYAGHKHTPGVINSLGVGFQRDYNHNLTLSLWNPELGGGLFNLKNSLAWLTNNRFYQEDPNGNMTFAGEESQHFINTVKYTGTADFSSLAGGRVKQSLGLSGDFTHLDSTNDGLHNQLSGVVKETTKITITNLAGGNLSASLPLAAKICANDTNLNWAFVPKAGLALEFTNITWTLDAYRMVQFPNMDDLFWEGGGFHGNPNLKPESGWGADLGFKLNNLAVGKSLINAGLTLFLSYYKDKIQWSTGTTENLSSAFYLGLDFSAGASFFNGLMTLDLSGEYLYNRLLDKSNQYTYGKRIMWTPDFTCSLTLGWNLEFAKIRLSAQYTGYRYTSNMNLYWLDPYLLINLSLEAPQISGKFTPFVKIDNLLNWQYQAVEGYPMPGASLTIGARYNFF